MAGGSVLYDFVRWLRMLIRGTSLPCNHSFTTVVTTATDVTEWSGATHDVADLSKWRLGLAQFVFVTICLYLGISTFAFVYLWGFTWSDFDLEGKALDKNWDTVKKRSWWSITCSWETVRCAKTEVGLIACGSGHVMWQLAIQRWHLLTAVTNYNAGW